MTRLALTFDRLVTALLGLGLVAVGLTAVAWENGRVVDGRHVSFAVVVDAAQAGWWPWAIGACGIVLIVIGLRWLASHRPARKASRVRLESLESQGVSPDTADASSVAHAAAAVLASDPAVLKATGTATLHTNTPTVTLTATVNARHGLHAGARAADATARDVALMLGNSVAVRTVLKVDTKRGRSAVV